jgi:hypothetical protein
LVILKNHTRDGGFAAGSAEQLSQPEPLAWGLPACWRRCWLGTGGKRHARKTKTLIQMNSFGIDIRLCDCF